jgi:hypothetical protein
MAKDFPILSVKDEKILKNTGTEQRAFWAKVGVTRRVRFLGILIFKHASTGNFPDPGDKD